MDIPSIGFQIIDFPSMDIPYIGESVFESVSNSVDDYYLLDSENYQLLDSEDYYLTVKG